MITLKGVRAASITLRQQGTKSIFKNHINIELEVNKTLEQKHKTP